MNTEYRNGSYEYLKGLTEDEVVEKTLENMSDPEVVGWETAKEIPATRKQRRAWERKAKRQRMKPVKQRPG